MPNLHLCVDITDFEIMHATLTVQVLDKRKPDGGVIYNEELYKEERNRANFSHFTQSSGSFRMTLAEIDTFLRALSVSQEIKLTSPARLKKERELAGSDPSRNRLSNAIPNLINEQGDVEKTGDTMTVDNGTKLASPSQMAEKYAANEDE